MGQEEEVSHIFSCFRQRLVFCPTHSLLLPFSRRLCFHATSCHWRRSYALLSEYRTIWCPEAPEIALRIFHCRCGLKHRFLVLTEVKRGKGHGPNAAASRQTSLTGLGDLSDDARKEFGAQPMQKSSQGLLDCHSPPNHKGLSNLQIQIWSPSRASGTRSETVIKESETVIKEGSGNIPQLKFDLFLARWKLVPACIFLMVLLTTSFSIVPVAIVK